MFRINNQILEITRGDDKDFTFIINSGTPLHPIPEVLSEGEYLYFGVMEANQKWEDSVIRKKLSSDNIDSEGNITLHFYSEDTEELSPGTYWYMIKLYRLDSTLGEYFINTVANKTKFIIW